MEYQKIINLSDNMPNQPSIIRTKNWAELNDELRGTYNANSQIKLKISMFRSRLCDYSDTYILVKATIAVPNSTAAANPNVRRKIIIKNCAPFTNCIYETKNTQIDNAKDIYIVMPMYDLVDYSDNCFKTSGRLWQYYRDELFLNANGTVADFPADNNNSASFKFRTKLAGKIGNDGTKNVKIRTPLILGENLKYR